MATRPARPANVPARLGHEYRRTGALNLLAAFDTRTGEVVGVCRPRKRQVEFIELLAEIDRTTPGSVEHIHIICDNVRMHRGKLICAWLEKHPRFQMHFTPVHCSWMNQVEQWFSILHRKRFAAPNFADLKHLESRIKAFIVEWNAVADRGAVLSDQGRLAIRVVGERQVTRGQVPATPRGSRETHPC